MEVSGQIRGPALGLIETRGYLPLVAAVDAAVKAARVALTSKTLVGGGLVNATVSGDVGAVRAALSAAWASISQMGADGMTHVIARPDPAVWALLAKDGRPAEVPPDPDAGTAAPPAVRPTPEVPALKPDSEPPAPRAESEVPAVKAEAGMPAAPGGPVPNPVPAAEKAGKSGAPAPPKSAGKPKKPRKPTKK